MNCFDDRPIWLFAGLLLAAPLHATCDRHNQEIGFGLPSDLIYVDGFETPAQF